MASTPPGNSSSKSRIQAIILVLLLGGVLTALFLLLRPGAVCGDSVCDRDGGESFLVCAADCPSACGDGYCNPAKETAVSCPADCKTVCGDGRCDPPSETAATCPKDCAVCGNGKCEPPSETVASCPKDCNLCGNGKCDAGETAKACPLDCQPPGKCRDPNFRKMLVRIVKDCEGACGFEAKNPVVGLELEQFKTIFASKGDTGYGTYFALFGCNVFNADGTDCKGFDSFYAEPAKCPVDNAFECATRASDACNPAGAQGRCQKYGKVIEDEFRGFTQKWKDAKYFILLGTASRSGNDAAAGKETMSVGNQKLALKRAASLESLLSRLRPEFASRGDHLDGKAYKVALDNTKQFFDTPEFGGMIKTQLDAMGRPDRGFTPTSANAVNRSVFVLAIECDLSAEGIE
jgi:hypothetical protein